MKNRVSYIGSAVFLLLALIIIIAKPFSPDLGETGQMVMGGLLITIGIWIFKPFGLPFSIGGAFLAFFLLLLGLPASTVFSGFTQTAIWTLIPALFFGYVLQKTGLGKRIAFAIIKLFKPTYLSMIIAFALIGIILSILTPSITVRVAIVMPIAVQCCELFNLERESKGNSLLLLTAFAMSLLPGTGWLSGSLWGPIIQGLFNSVSELEGLVTFDSWFQVAFIPMELTTILLIFGGYFILKPKEQLSGNATTILKQSKTEPVSREERAAAIILVGVFALFTTNSIHSIPDAAVCLLALVFFFAFGILTVSEFSTGINWDLIVFIGIALGLGVIFSSTGISDWLASIVVTALSPIGGSPWLFVLITTVIIFAWKFVDIAILIPTMAILIPILPAIFEAYGVNPLVWIIIFLTSGNAMFMAYQNMWALMSQGIAGERSWTAGHLRKYGFVYFLSCIIALVVAVLLYQWGGLL